MGVCVCEEGGGLHGVNLAPSFPLSPCPLHKYMYHGWGVGGGGGGKDTKVTMECNCVCVYAFGGEEREDD